MKTLFKMVVIAIAFLFSTTSISFSTPYNTFKTVTYTGNGETQEINVGFKPGIVWIKNRNAAYNHTLFDAVREDNALAPSDTAGAFAWDAMDYDTDGLILKSGSIHINKAGESFVAWCWKAGDEVVSNTDGSITSTISANPEAGFSIVKYSGDGIAGATVGHGLQAAPKLIIVKNLIDNLDWQVYHSDMGPEYSQWLNSTAASNTSVICWDNTAPTQEVFSLGNGGYGNGVGDSTIAYCFAEVEGVSAIGSYIGNGSASGPTIDCGFRPGFIMVKRTDTTGNWYMYDSKRGPFTSNNAVLQANSTASEIVDADIDFLIDGFQPKSTSMNTNASGGKYIYMAFAGNDGPEISFSSDVTSIDHEAEPAEAATLSWDVSYADTVTIEPEGGTVESSGTLQVSPNYQTTYTLTATVGEETFSKTVFIDVTNGYDQGVGFSVKGPMGVGILNPTQMLEVNGTIKAKEVIVTSEGWADYVFGDTYKLPGLSSVENHIKTHRHLPGIPSADQLGSDGLPVSQMLELQMKKIEELTLYIIELSKENEALEQRLNALE